MQASGSIKRFIRCLPGFVAAAMLLGIAPLKPVVPAHAQFFESRGVIDVHRRPTREEVQRRSRRQDAVQELRRKPRRSKPAVAPARRAKPAQAPAVPQIQSIDKVDDAKVVLVIGDFLAGGLADGLGEIFAEDSNIRVVDRINGSSGIVRDDYFDWPAEIGSILDEEKPAAVVLMLGSNDRQQIKIGSERLDVRSDGWLKEYARRAAALATAVESRGIPLIWVGMLPFRQASLTSDVLVYNDIYRSVAAAADADYVDIWDGFVDENGAFITTGPDMNGQQARLRSSDGINLTAAGKRKIAFYAEKPLRKLLGTSRGADVGLPGPAYQPGADLRLGSEEPLRVLRTVPIALADPELDGGTTLLGDDETVGQITAADQQMREQRNGVGTQEGRADDFRGSDATASKRTAGSTASVQPSAVQDGLKEP